MLKVQRTANGEVEFTLSGRMDADNVAEFNALFRAEAEGRRIVLDLKDLTLVDRDAVRFLERCEADSITLKNCAECVREWITKSRGSGYPQEGPWYVRIANIADEGDRNGGTSKLDR